MMVKFCVQKSDDSDQLMIRLVLFLFLVSITGTHNHIKCQHDGKLLTVYKHRIILICDWFCFCFYFLFHLLENQSFQETQKNVFEQPLCACIVKVRYVFSPLPPVPYCLGNTWIVYRPKKMFSKFWTPSSSQKAAVCVFRISILLGYGNSKNETHNTKNDDWFIWKPVSSLKHTRTTVDIHSWLSIVCFYECFLFYSLCNSLIPSIWSYFTFESPFFPIKSTRPAECMGLEIGNGFGKSIIGFWFQAIEFLSATQEIERSMWFNLTFRDLLVSIVAFPLCFLSFFFFFLIFGWVFNFLSPVQAWLWITELKSWLFGIYLVQDFYAE